MLTSTARIFDSTVSGGVSIGGTVTGGTDQCVLFVDGTVLGQDTNFKYNKTDDILTVGTTYWDGNLARFGAEDVIGTDSPGINLDLYAGAGTGTGLGGNLRVFVAPASASSGSTPNTPYNAFSIGGGGEIVSEYRPAAGVTTKLLVSKLVGGTPNGTFLHTDANGSSFTGAGDWSGQGMADNAGVIGWSNTAATEVRAIFADSDEMSMSYTVSGTTHKVKVDSSGVFVRGKDDSASTIGFYVENQDEDDALRVYNDGDVTLRVGTSGTYAGVGGVTGTDTAQYGNVGTGEDNLGQIVVGSNSLAEDGDYVEIHYAGTFANNANNKRIKLYFGATAMIDMSDTYQDGSWSIRAKVVRTGASSQKFIAEWQADNGSSNTKITSVNYGTASETLGSSVTVKATAEATSDDDVTQEIGTMSWHPAMAAA